MLYVRDTLDDFVAAGGNGQSCDPAAKKWKLAAVLIVTSWTQFYLTSCCDGQHLYCHEQSCYLATVKLSKVSGRPEFVFESS